MHEGMNMTEEGNDGEGEPKDEREVRERQDASYEDVLTQFRGLCAEGIVDPYVTGHASTEQAWDMYEAWKRSSGVSQRGIDSVAKAQDIVRAERIFLDAGYGGPVHLRRALRHLNTAYADMVNKSELGLGRENTSDEDNAIMEVLSGAIDALEDELGATDPKERAKSEVEDRILEVKEKVENGDIIDAIRLTVSTIHHPDLKRYFKKDPERLAYLMKLRSALYHVRDGGDASEIDTIN